MDVGNAGVMRRWSVFDEFPDYQGFRIANDAFEFLLLGLKDPLTPALILVSTLHNYVREFKTTLDIGNNEPAAATFISS